MLSDFEVNQGRPIVLWLYGVVPHTTSSFGDAGASATYHGFGIDPEVVKFCEGVGTKFSNRVQYS